MSKETVKKNHSTEKSNKTTVMPPKTKGVLMIDNYDSFTYNLAQYVWELGYDCRVLRCDEATLEKEIDFPSRYSHLIISPGPGRPKDAGLSCNFIRLWAGRIPILGVCMGLQCIAEVYGGKIVQAKKILHGKVSMLSHNGKGMFAGEKNPLEVARYHSLVVEPDSVPDCFDVTAQDSSGEVMAIQHVDLPIYGVQFHPESIATPSGKVMLQRFLQGI